MTNFRLFFGAIGSFIRMFAPFFIGYGLLVNLIAFGMYYFDKRAAKKHRWRIPEAHLICIALLGGSAGALAAMLLFRHKTKHPKFTVTVPLLLILQVAALGLCLAC